MIQELAGFDPSRYEEVASSRLREGLEAFSLRMKDRAMAMYQHQQSLYAAGALKKAPDVPPILKRK